MENFNYTDYWLRQRTRPKPKNPAADIAVATPGAIGAAKKVLYENYLKLNAHIKKPYVPHDGHRNENLMALALGGFIEPGDDMRDNVVIKNKIKAIKSAKVQLQKYESRLANIDWDNAHTGRMGVGANIHSPVYLRGKVAYRFLDTQTRLVDISFRQIIRVLVCQHKISRDAGKTAIRNYLSGGHIPIWTNQKIRRYLINLNQSKKRANTIGSLTAKSRRKKSLIKINGHGVYLQKAGFEDISPEILETEYRKKLNDDNHLGGGGGN